MINSVNVFEFSNAPHETSLISAVRVFELHGLPVSLFVNKTAYNRLKKMDCFADLSVNKSYSLKSIIYLFRSRNYLNLFNTLSLRSIFSIIFFTFFSNKNVFYIRNANSCFNYSTHDMTFLNRIISNILVFLKKRLVTSAYGLVCGSSNVKKYIESQSSKRTMLLPFTFRIEGEPKMKNEEKFILVIPGNIDIKRKKIDLLEAALTSLNDEEKNRIKVVMLGRPKTEDDEKSLIEMKEKSNVEIEYYKRFIPDVLFEETILKADLIFGSLVSNYYDRFYSEIYGLTKDTGIEAHAIVNGKPFLVNEEYNSDDEYSSSTLKYKSSEECSLLLSKCINDIDFFSLLTREAEKNSIKFSVDKVSQQYLWIVNDD